MTITTMALIPGREKTPLIKIKIKYAKKMKKIVDTLEMRWYYN